MFGLWGGGGLVPLCCGAVACPQPEPIIRRVMGLVLDSKIRRAFSQLKPWGVQRGCQFWAYGAFILGWGWFKGGLVFQVAVHLGAGSVGRGYGPGFSKISTQITPSGVRDCCCVFLLKKWVHTKYVFGGKNGFPWVVLILLCVLLNQAFCCGGGWKLKSRKTQVFSKNSSNFFKN